jgi:RNA polymerase sigma-70 factor (ECF subfamily)
MDAGDSPTTDHDPSDEDLMRQLTDGRAEALGPLHGRYAGRLYGLAARALGRAAAEEVVQEVFVAVWRNADDFDPARGSFRAWVMQIAHRRVLNELRRRGRRPAAAPDPDGRCLAAQPDPDAGPAEAAWRAYRRSAVRSAVATLPPPQRQALSLAFFEDLTHEQVASYLDVPLGTAKFRIRAGMQKLRVLLTPVFALLLAFAGLTAYRLRVDQLRDERALDTLTRSDLVSRRLVAAAGVPKTAHGEYRSRPGVPLAVLTLSHLPPAPAGQTYHVWVLHRGRWTPLGVARPGAEGRVLLIVEGPHLASIPDEVRVTREASAGGDAPRGASVVVWPGR